MDASWTEGFAVVDLPGGNPGKHGDYAEIEVLLPGGQDNRVQLRLAAAMDWPLDYDGAVIPSAEGVSRCRAGFPVDLPGGDQQMTLVVSLPLLARWNGTCRRAVIGEVLDRLAKAEIQHKVVQIAAGGVIYLPTTAAEP
jgi:hypothetical protein